MNASNSHKESWYQAKIMKWLRAAYPRAFVWKAAAGPYSQGGIPDICAIIDGTFFGFEVKRPESRARVSPLQKQAIAAIRAAGGVAAVVTSVEETRAVIEKGRLP